MAWICIDEICFMFIVLLMWMYNYNVLMLLWCVTYTASFVSLSDNKGSLTKDLEFFQLYTYVLCAHLCFENFIKPPPVRWFLHLLSTSTWAYTWQTDWQRWMMSFMNEKWLVDATCPDNARWNWKFGRGHIDVDYDPCFFKQLNEVVVICVEFI